MTLIVSPPRSVAARAAPLFKSEWSTGTGSGATALADGVWGLVTNGQEIDVVAAPGTSPGFTNALRVARFTGVSPGAQWCQVQNAWALPAVGDWLYFRSYFYCDMATLSSTEANHHPIEAAYSGAATSGYALKMQPNGDGTFYLRQAVSSAANGLLGSGIWYFAKSNGSGVRDKLANAQWWRVEQGWQYTATDGAGLGTWTVWLRVYDDTPALWGDPTSNVRRQTGPAYPVMNTVNTGIKALEAEMRKLRIGTNGGTWSNGSAEYFYHAAVAVCSDDWVGPYVPGWG